MFGLVPFTKQLNLIAPISFDLGVFCNSLIINTLRNSLKINELCGFCNSLIINTL